MINAWKESGDTAKLISALVWSNHYYRNAGFIDEAVKYTSLALKYSEQFKDSTLLCEANWCLAVLQRYKNDFKMQIKYLNECLRWYNRKSKNLTEIEFLEEKVAAFKNLNQNDSVFNINNVIISKARKKGDSALVFSSLLAQAKFYLNKKDAVKADECIQHAMSAYYDKSPRYYYGLIQIQLELYGLTGEKEKQDMILDELISTAKASKENDENDYKSVAYICFNGKRYADAKYFLDKCYDYFVRKGIKDEYNYLNYQYAISLAYIGDYKNAYEYYCDYTIINDSILSEHNSKNIAELENRYQSEKKALQIVGLQNEKSLQETEIGRQRLQKVFFGIAFGLGLLFAVVLYRAFRSKQKDNAIITLQKSLVEEKNKEVLDSINYAKKLQDAILPPRYFVNKYLPENFILYRPKDIVAGDFYLWK
ncbi:MAG: hypothetical protein IPJ32_07310 [Sphingobacteriaceae bacterium]|nr:hypothetical protein [Sphingobacteriaceae bacterium]